MTAKFLLMTRPQAASAGFVESLSPKAKAALTIEIAPLLEIIPTGNDPALDRTDAVIFTSANGVANAPDGAGRVAFCVGSRTAAKATARNWDVRLTAQDAESLLNLLADHQPRRVVHLAGVHRRGDIVRTLETMGWGARTEVLYDQILRPLSARARAILSGRDPVILPLFSPRTAAHLASEIDSAPGTTVLALSKAVADTLDASVFGALRTLPEPTHRQMLDAIENIILRTTSS